MTQPTFPGDMSRRTLRMLLDASTLLLLVLCVPVVILVVGAPLALAARLLLELFTRF